MKHNIRFKLLGLIAVAAMLLTAACERDPLNEAVSDASDYVTVSFTVQPETVKAATRADDGKPDSKVDYTGSHISDGTKAKILVYAVYNANGELLPEYGQENTEGVFLPDGSPLGEGQTYIDLDEDVENKQFPVKIELSVRRGETYKVAFWAQSKDCKFYDIKNLKQVKVHYAEIESGEESSTPNNDETRDAFCRVETLKIDSKDKENRVVYLYRPLAQINVGTTGYDYETVVQDAKSQYAYTRMQIVTAARYLDVVNDKIVTDTGADNHSALEFGWAPLPAYINCDGVPEDLKAVHEKEEFLKVHLKDNIKGNYMEDTNRDGFSDYAGLDNDGKLTETFKYLSMCYVLVPSETGDDGKYTTTTIDRIRVWIAPKDGTDGIDEDKAIEIVDIANVHATRNWRTNIVGDIMTTSVPFQVVLDPIYAGDYNGFYENGNVTWSGPLDEKGGAYYDAEHDEILISNANGLLWLQQMVNGDLVYNLSENGVKAGDPIKYYNESHEERTFGSGDVDDRYYFKGIKDPTTIIADYDPDYENKMEAAKLLKARILRATHQDKNMGYNEKTLSWPTRNNFHFVGVDGPANVKLIADIDMSGIDWLGIGFDCKMDQTADMLFDNGTQSSSSEKNNSVYDKKQHRGFFGHFDGNGHTVSNLKTKRFSMDVHEKSYQLTSGGPYDGAVQWYARGFFGQIGGEALIENLTLRNVDIHGYHCVGGIAGAAIGVNPAEKKGTNIIIRNCIVDGGKIENVPMYRGDVIIGKDRTWARGVNTGGIVGLYNASGSIDNCRVSNMTINGYRMVGGIVGSIDHFYLAYYNDYKNKGYNERKSESSVNNVRPQSISGNRITNTLILADHFKPFSILRHDKDYKDNTKTTAWAYGFSWGSVYDTLVDRIAGGPNGCTNVDVVNGNDVYGDDVQLIDLSGNYKLKGNVIEGRTTDLHNVPVENLPVLDNWFVDYVQVTSNLIGKAASYKRYETKEFAFFSTKANEKLQSPFNMFSSYDRIWDTNTGLVGMYVGAVELSGVERGNAGNVIETNRVLSVREAMGVNDCAVMISACDRTQFTGNTNISWYSSAETTLKYLTVRGNPYAYTGICLSPNERMKTIKISNVAVYDVYQTLALSNLESVEGNVWPKSVNAVSVDLKVDNSNLRGYTVPGAGWKSIAYDTVIFERGAHILKEGEGDLTTEYTCKIESDTRFTNCTFKAPYIIEIGAKATAKFSNCKAVYGTMETVLEVPDGCKKIIVDDTGNVTYDEE